MKGVWCLLYSAVSWLVRKLRPVGDHFFGRPFVKRFDLCSRTVVCLSVCPACMSVCNVAVLWPNGWTDQDETWHAGRPQPWPHCVRWGPSSPSPKGHSPPNFRLISVVVKWLHGRSCHWYGCRPQPRGLCVRWRPSPSPQKGAKPPIFGPRLLWPNGWMDQDATWYRGKRRLRRRCVRWGSQLPPTGAQSPSFRFVSIVAKRLDGWRCHLVWK